MHDHDRDPTLPHPVSLDPLDGSIRFGGQVFPLDLAPGGLPPSFELSQLTCKVEGRNVDCMFASASTEADGTRYGLSFRFEAGRPVGAFLSIEPPHLRDLTDDEFYLRVEDRHLFHRQWLRRMGLPASGRTAWGSCGVARDKSENVFIYLRPRGAGR